jgi:Peptidase family S41/Tricorn protease C1 domain
MRGRVLVKCLGVAFVSIVLSAVVVPANTQHSNLPNHTADGLWLSDGYGLLLEVGGSILQAFELTSISCLPSWSAMHDPNDVRGPEIVFKGDQTVRLAVGTPADVMRMRRDGTVSDVLLRRVAVRPRSCGQASDNSPQANYAIFWQTFAEQYPFFELHHLDWRAVNNKFRPQVTAATKPAELFKILRRMIEPLRDVHTGLMAPDLKEDFQGWRSDPNQLEEDDWKKVSKLLESMYVHPGLRSYCRGRVQFGIVRRSAGYLRITAFYDYVDTKSSAAALEALQLALDGIFEEAAKLTALVIDVRLNKGGDDALALEIASRLTRNKYLAYAKVARNNPDGALRFTAPQEVWVIPSTRPGFHGRVALLTGPDTVSAGETFTMALMGREPHVARIGLNTQGVFSDVLHRWLPNGWRFQLPNEKYLTRDRQSFDGSGVPPEIRVPFFSPEDIQRGRDSALEAALKILGGEGPGQ